MQALEAAIQSSDLLAVRFDESFSRLFVFNAKTGQGIESQDEGNSIFRIMTAVEVEDIQDWVPAPGYFNDEADA